MAAGSKKVIYAALVGNALIAVTKFVAAGATGSSAMLSEGIHSVVDTGNQILLLHGLRRAAKPADDRHPFGYGAELYFWAFVVAILIFAIGAGISFYEGVHKIQAPLPVSNPMVNYVVLGLAFVFEAGAWSIAFREFRRTKGRGGWLEAVRASKDPSVFTVLFEDTAAMFGLVAAFLGIAGAQMFGIAELDGVASIVIGIILGVTALLLAIETKGLLIGEGASPEVVATITNIANATEVVDQVNEIRTLHRGPNDILLALSLDFEDNLTAGKVEDAIHDLEVAIRQQIPEIRRVFIEVQSARDHRADLRRAAIPETSPKSAGQERP
jgi:cation diffusion facilitator family transporter